MNLRPLYGALFLALASCAHSDTKELNAKRGDIYFNSGTSALMNGDFTGALASLQEAVKYDPKSPAAWTNLGLAYGGKDEFARAEEAWKKALVIDPNWSDARANLGALYIRQKRWKEAESQLRTVEKDLIYPRMAQVHYNLALVYIEGKRPLLAEQQLRASLKADPTFCNAWFLTARLQKEKGDFEQATESFRKSVAGICFNNPEAHYEISSLYLKSRDVARAKSKLLEIIQLFPQSEWAKKAELTLNMIR